MLVGPDGEPVPPPPPKPATPSLASSEAGYASAVSNGSTAAQSAALSTLEASAWSAVMAEHLQSEHVSAAPGTASYAKAEQALLNDPTALAAVTAQVVSGQSATLKADGLSPTDVLDAIRAGEIVLRAQFSVASKTSANGMVQLSSLAKGFAPGHLSPAATQAALLALSQGLTGASPGVVNAVLGSAWVRSLGQSVADQAMPGGTVSAQSVQTLAQTLGGTDPRLAAWIINNATTSSGHSLLAGLQGFISDPSNGDGTTLVSLADLYATVDPAAGAPTTTVDPGSPLNAFSVNGASVGRELASWVYARWTSPSVVQTYNQGGRAEALSGPSIVDHGAQDAQAIETALTGKVDSDSAGLPRGMFYAVLGMARTHGLLTPNSAAAASADGVFQTLQKFLGPDPAPDRTASALDPAHPTASQALAIVTRLQQELDADEAKLAKALPVGSSISGTQLWQLAAEQVEQTDPQYTTSDATALAQMTVQGVETSLQAAAAKSNTYLSPNAATDAAARVVGQWNLFTPGVVRQATAGLLAPKPAAGPSAQAVANLYAEFGAGKISTAQLHTQLVAWLQQAYPKLSLTALLNDPRDQNELTEAYTQLAMAAPSSVQTRLSTDVQAGLFVAQSLGSGSQAASLNTLLGSLPTLTPAVQAAVLSDGRVAVLLEATTGASAASIDRTLAPLLRSYQSASPSQRETLVSEGLSTVAREVAVYEAGGLSAGSPGRAAVVALLNQPAVQTLLKDAKAQSTTVAGLAPLLQAAQGSAVLSVALYAEAAPAIRTQLSQLDVTNVTSLQRAGSIYSVLSAAASSLPTDLTSLLGAVLPRGTLPTTVPSNSVSPAALFGDDRSSDLPSPLVTAPASYLDSPTALLSDYRGEVATAIRAQITTAPTTRVVTSGGGRFVTQSVVETAQGQTQQAFAQGVKQAAQAGDGGLFSDLVDPPSGSGSGTSSAPAIAASTPAGQLIWQALGATPPAPGSHASSSQDPTAQALANAQQIDGIRFQAASTTTQLSTLVGEAYGLPPDADGTYAANTLVYGTTTIGDIVKQLQQTSGAPASITKPVLVRAVPLLIDGVSSSAFEVKTASGTEVLGPDGQVYAN